MADAVCRLKDLALPVDSSASVLTMSVEPRDLVLLEGGMGSGKTTLLKLIAGLIRPAGGSVELFGQDLAKLSRRRLLRLRERLGVVFERDGLIASWGVCENLLLPLRYREPGDDSAHLARIHRWLERVGEAPEVLDQHVAQLTGRQRRRLALLRAMVLEPALMLLDELPTYLNADEAETLRIVKTLNAAECAIIACAPASWARLFPGRRVRVAKLDAPARPARQKRHHGAPLSTESNS